MQVVQSKGRGNRWANKAAYSTNPTSNQLDALSVNQRTLREFVNAVNATKAVLQQIKSMKEGRLEFVNATNTTKATL